LVNYIEALNQREGVDEQRDRQRERERWADRQRDRHRETNSISTCLNIYGYKLWND